MFKIRTMNTISPLGLELLEKKGCEVGKNVPEPEALLLRSAELHDMDFPKELLCIGRAGAGTNNIPVDACSERGIVVFNAPGANAEAVKELVICEMVMASRDVAGAMDWVKSIAGEGDNIPEIVEKGKASFSGPELKGKTLGVVGLGAVGALVANIALELGMEVYGFDPFMSVDAAWLLSREVRHADDVGEIYAKSDYISVNVPFTDSTHNMINADAIKAMKDGVRIMNESRAEVVDDDAMIAALDVGKVAKYVTDFPNAKLIGAPNVIALPHIGACTPESEDNCAVMAAKEIYDYLKNGNIRNSVNLPSACLERVGVCRLCVLHRNVPNMINSFLDLVSERNINVEHMINKARGSYAYTMMDLDAVIDRDMADRILASRDVLRVRVLAV
ncbi:MAG: 3-phosphoglycerate dehydrogenase family protein [Oscillospiraceae bacterium]